MKGTALAILAILGLTLLAHPAFAAKKAAQPVKAPPAKAAPAAKAQPKEPSAEVLPFPGDMSFGHDQGQIIVFSHKNHLKRKGVTCQSCHTELFEMKYGAAEEKGDFRMPVLYEGRYCGACHDGKKAFGTEDFALCSKCHFAKSALPAPEQTAKGPRAPIELGSGDSVVVFKHEAHDFLGCADCHAKLFPLKKTGTITTMDEINDKKSCGSCHNGQVAFEPTECGKCHPKM